MNASALAHFEATHLPGYISQFSPHAIYCNWMLPQEMVEQVLASPGKLQMLGLSKFENT